MYNEPAIQDTREILIKGAQPLENPPLERDVFESFSSFGT
jgi:hypothetical protein